jgi:hypothetical protein
MGYDEGDRNFGVEVPVEQQAQLWHNRWGLGGQGSSVVLCALSMACCSSFCWAVLTCAMLVWAGLGPGRLEWFLLSAPRVKLLQARSIATGYMLL